MVFTYIAVKWFLVLVIHFLTMFVLDFKKNMVKKGFRETVDQMDKFYSLLFL